MGRLIHGRMHRHMCMDTRISKTRSKRRKWIQEYNSYRSREVCGDSYRELCEHLPGPHTSLLLGDAFMNILEVSDDFAKGFPQSRFHNGKGERNSGLCPQPEKALEVYDEAYRKNPHDASLVSRIGKACVKAHEYNKVRERGAGRNSPAG